MARTCTVTLVDDDTSCTVELLMEEAPITCEAIWTALPIQGQLIHGKFSGEEVFTVPEEIETLGLEPENWEFNVSPGEIGYWYSFWDEGEYERGQKEFDEIVFIYGRDVRVRKGADRISAVNVFGEVTENFDAYSKACERTRIEGAKTVRIERNQ